MKSPSEYSWRKPTKKKTDEKQLLRLVFVKNNNDKKFVQVLNVTFTQ